MMSMLCCAAGIHGISFVMKEHRHNNLLPVMISESSYRAILNDDVVMGESTREEKPPFKRLGESYAINIVDEGIQSHI